MNITINSSSQAVKKPMAQVLTFESNFDLEIDEYTLVATTVQVDSVRRLIDIQRQKKAIEAVEKKEKDFLIKQMGKKERLIGPDGMELATYKRDGDSTKWDKEALALLYPDVFADTRCVWQEKGSMRFLVKK